MAGKWEYAVLRFTRDPGDDILATKGWLLLPGAESWEEIEGEHPAPHKEALKLGAEGWELVGPPVSQDSVFTYKAANETWHDRAYWVERDFWFKREMA